MPDNLDRNVDLYIEFAYKIFDRLGVPVGPVDAMLLVDDWINIVERHMRPISVAHEQAIVEADARNAGVHDYQH